MAGFFILSFTMLLFLLVSLVGSQDLPNLITFPSVVYLRPGDDFQLACSTDHGIQTRIYTNTESVPDAGVLEAQSKAYHARGKVADSSTTIHEYENATTADSGIYTCIVYHAHEEEGYPSYSRAECLVQVVDLCADVTCTGYLETCVPNYRRGTAECACDFTCSMDMAAVCSDTCELFWNECAMEEASCADKVPRIVERHAFCPTTVAPVTRQVGEQEVEIEEGEIVTLDAGVISSGTPPVQVTWTFTAPGDSAVEVGEGESLNIVAVSDGLYDATVKHCAAPVANTRFRVSLLEKITTPTAPTPPRFMTSMSPSDLPHNLIVGSHHVCSIFPGGVVEAFDGSAAAHDLACSHVLASDAAPERDLTRPWFIYGVFDKQDGEIALSALTFYVGAHTFELMRGWMVNLNGVKQELREGLPITVGESDCFVMYSELHLQLNCEYFEAYYDGVMSGHIRVKSLASSAPLAKGTTNFGLCYDAWSGWRKSWQVGRTQGVCAVSRTRPECLGSDQSCTAPLLPAPSAHNGPFAACEAGYTRSCLEMNCGSEQATPLQRCALERAVRTSCALKYGRGIGTSGLSACPEDDCEWQTTVLDRGCPQETPPFNCPRS